ncbi:heterokaryon incompatibility protein-domain-containing protein [Xylaria cubensis]|nr:heterokaryon incompatibility protein-domain-containing protein [Xylaria cubensis]
MEPLERWQDTYYVAWEKLPSQATPHPPPLAAGHATHSYAALLPPHEDFRILHLQPSTNIQSKLECSLQHVSFEQCPIYEAVSYVWGDQTDTVTAHLNGREVTITANLGDVLRNLRLATETRALWVDGLCIDQANPTERSSQVRMMGRIYSACVRGLVWLGNADLSRLRGLKIASLLTRGDIDYIRSRASEAIQSKHANHNSILHVDATQILPFKDWDALRSLFVEPDIWHRVWVMQEMACAPKILLVLGGESLEWEVIASFLDSEGYPDAYHGPFHHNDYEYWINETFGHIQVIEHQRRVSRELSMGRQSKLLDVLARFRYTAATDPRDKIYGLLGLASDSQGVIPDYEKSVKDVYVDFFQTHVNETRQLDLLCQNPWGNRAHGPSNTELDLPSWCPDFFSPKNTTLLFAQRSIFSAGSEYCDVPCQVSSQSRLNLPGSILLGSLSSIYGKIDQISQPCQTIPGNMPPELQDEDLNTSHPLMYRHTGETAFQAYWRTMMADCEIYPTRRLSDSSLDALKIVLDRWRDNPAKFDNWLPLNRIQMLTKMGAGWRFSITDHHGVYCMVPFASEPGDVLAVMKGGKVPLVLRPNIPQESGDVAGFRVVGPAYAHGFMSGEAAEAVEKGLLCTEDIVLV